MKKMTGTALLFFSLFAFGQTENPAPGWQLKDPAADKVLGISMEKVYSDLLRKKKLKPVIVAVIDGGVDVNHDDLRNVIWTNKKEVGGNGTDDDGNGYIDDVHGWNFVSTMKRGDKEFDIRFGQQQLKAAGVSGTDTTEWQKFTDRLLFPDRENLRIAMEDKLALDNILGKINKTNPIEEDFKNYRYRNEAELRVITDMVYGLRGHSGYVAYRKAMLQHMIEYYRMQLQYYELQDYDLATGGPTTYHGTHIAGIIAAERNNGLGMDGVASTAKIMVLRAIKGLDLKPGSATPELVLQGLEGEVNPTAASIRYAVDNGAKVINMSFGLKQPVLQGSVLDAVKYALSKDVLIIHAAGNGSTDIDTYDAVESPENWIEVGAAGWRVDDNIVVSFSNYGKASVDVFAPGVGIYSTAPRSLYYTDMGTSQAAPIVAGMAAMLRSAFPKLTAIQVKQIILETVTKADPLRDKCRAGGVVNAYKAFLLASEISKK